MCTEKRLTPSAAQSKQRRHNKVHLTTLPDPNHTAQLPSEQTPPAPPYPVLQGAQGKPSITAAFIIRWGELPGKHKPLTVKTIKPASTCL